MLCGLAGKIAKKGVTSGDRVALLTMGEKVLYCDIEMS